MTPPAVATPSTAMRTTATTATTVTTVTTVTMATTTPRHQHRENSSSPVYVPRTQTARLPAAASNPGSVRAPL